jgi:hypothetical protein
MLDNYSRTLYRKRKAYTIQTELGSPRQCFYFLQLVSQFDDNSAYLLGLDENLLCQRGYFF